MNRPSTQRTTCSAIALALAAALPLAANAGSFQLPTDNAAGWARANAGGSLFPNDPTAAYNNPAAMAFFSAPELQVSAIGIRPSAEFHGNFTDATGAPVSGSNPNGFGRFIPFPNIDFVAPVTDRFAIGGSVTVPYGLANRYNNSWEGRYFGTKTSVQSVAVSLSAAYKVNDEFSMGLGIVGQHTKAQLNTTLDPCGTALALGIRACYPQSNDVAMNINVKKKFAFGYFGGFEFKPTEADAFGLSYHSRIQQTLSGKYAMYGSALGEQLIQLAPTVAPNAGLPVLNPAGANASAQFNMPAFASLDWTHAFNSAFTLAATARWTNWASFQSLVLTSNGNTLVALPQKYKDSWLYSVGGDYKLNDQWTLRAGVGYDETPTSTVSRDPRIPDGNRKLLGLGVGYRATNHFAFDLGYQHQFVGKTPVHLTNQLGLGAGSMNGYFQDDGDVVALTGTYTF